ncbi:MAG: TRAP transporter small permease [Polyangiales bacterium]
MEARSEVAPTPTAPSGEPAAWTQPLVKLDKAWTKLETYLVLGMLIAAILYMTGWVALNAFHTKGGKLANFPGGILTFAGLASALAWTRRPPAERHKRFLWVPAIAFLAGVCLLAVAKKQDYFANVSRWLSDASLVKQMGTPQIVSARLFTIWVALLGGSLATGAGRQINVDVVMRFLSPKPRLAVALFGYLVAGISCFVIAWGFVDYLAITRYAAAKDTPNGEKIGIITKSIGRHAFLVRRQIALDFRSFGNVVIGGKPYDKWYTGDEWNRELNESGWAEVYPPPAPAAGTPARAVAYPTKPCLSQKEAEDLIAKGGSTNPDWRLVGACDSGGPGSTRAPLATAPEPDDRTPLEADLSLLFPWGFLMIGLRFLLRGLLAIGGAVSTDPNAAHGADPEGHEHAVEPPIVEKRVDQEAKAHEGEHALPPDDTDPGDALDAAKAKVDATTSNLVDAEAGTPGERPHHSVAPPGEPSLTKVGTISKEELEALRKDLAPPPSKHDMPTAPPPPMAKETEKAARRSEPPDVPTAQRLEVAKQIAADEEEDRTLVGDLSELARAQEMIEKQKEDEKKKGGKG